MKQIITVLAILISGIASAQSDIYTASICGGGPANPRHIDFNGLDYVLVDGYRAIIEAEFNGDDTIICLSSNNNINNNWESYFENYTGSNDVVWVNAGGYHNISWPGTSANVRRRRSGEFVVSMRTNNVNSASRYTNARDAYNYAFRR